jgi:hypothetical protein
MNYSDYFENKVAALVNDSISIVVCVTNKQGIDTIQENFTVPKYKVEAILLEYDYYKAELGGNTVTIYVYDQEEI